jgi:hypothetical protein
MKGGRKIGLWGDRIKKYMKKLKKKRAKKRKSKRTVKMARKFRKRTRRKRGGNCDTIKEICASQYEKNAKLYKECIYDAKLTDVMIQAMKKRCDTKEMKPQSKKEWNMGDSNEEYEKARMRKAKEDEEEKKVKAYNKCKNDCETKCKRGGKKRRRRKSTKKKRKRRRKRTKKKRRRRRRRN